MIQTLLITGANNHDWRRTAPFCKALLEGTDKFAGDLTESPAEVLADAPALGQYQLFVLDYNGPGWGNAARTNFEAAVAGGTGICVLHAANNMKDWPEFEKMAGLLWRQGTGHGSYHEFQVAIVDHDHPITRGISDFLVSDELYHRLVNVHHVPDRVLGAAYPPSRRRSRPARGCPFGTTWSSRGWATTCDSSRGKSGAAGGRCARPPSDERRRVFQWQYARMAGGQTDGVRRW